MSLGGALVFDTSSSGEVIFIVDGEVIFIKQMELSTFQEKEGKRQTSLSFSFPNTRVPVPVPDKGGLDQKHTERTQE